MAEEGHSDLPAAGLIGCRPPRPPGPRFDPLPSVRNLGEWEYGSEAKRDALVLGLSRTWYL